jgi:hypothetical protein
MRPDQLLFAEDLSSAEFRSGVVEGFWGLPGGDILPEPPGWPKVVLWIAAAPREGAPDRFYFGLDAAGYRTDPPTGTLWDPATMAALAFDKRPKGRPNSRFAKVFRTDWEKGVALYHPFDRVAAKGHPNWRNEQPHLIWTPERTIVDYLEEFHGLLNCGDYVGV